MIIGTPSLITMVFHSGNQTNWKNHNFLQVNQDKTAISLVIFHLASWPLYGTVIAPIGYGAMAEPWGNGSVSNGGGPGTAQLLELGGCHGGEQLRWIRTEASLVERENLVAIYLIYMIVDFLKHI